MKIRLKTNQNTRCFLRSDILNSQSNRNLYLKFVQLRFHSRYQRLLLLILINNGIDMFSRQYEAVILPQLSEFYSKTYNWNIIYYLLRIKSMTYRVSKMWDNGKNSIRSNRSLIKSSRYIRKCAKIMNGPGYRNVVILTKRQHTPS